MSKMLSASCSTDWSSSSSSDGDNEANDSPHDDIWSPSLREAVFSNNDFGSWSSEARQDQLLGSSSLGSNYQAPQTHVSALSHQFGSQHPNISQSTSSSTRLPSFSSLRRDISNAHLRTLPIARPNSKGNALVPRLPSGTSDRLNLPGILSRPLSPPLPRSEAGRDPSKTPNPGSSPDSFGEAETARSITPCSTFDDFVDLTGESPNMPPNRSQRPLMRPRIPQEDATTKSRPSKRQKMSAHSPDMRKVEEIDLRDIDDDKSLSRVLEQQRMATVKAQQEQADKPLKLSTLQCIICMDAMTDITATTCGHLFCHSCLMEALIAGENQGSEPGKGSSKCPVCRKKVKRPKDSKDTSNCIPLELKLLAKSREVKDGGKARVQAF